MSFVITQPDLLTTAATQWAGLDTAMREENSVAAAPTLGAPPPAADEVSTMTAARFAAHAQQYQAISARAAALQQLFIDTLRGNADAYATAEAANANATAAADPAALTTVIGAAQSVGGFVTGPGQASAVVSVISGLSSGAQYLDGVLKTAGTAAVSSPAAEMVSTAASSVPVATDAGATGAPTRLAAARAASVGWATAAPGAGAAPAMAAGGAPTSVEPGAGSLVGHAAAGGMAGAAGATRTSRPANVSAIAVTPDRETSDPLRQALSSVSEKPESVQHWHTDKAQLEDLLDQLSTTPGVHAVHLCAGEVDAV